jgi:hypothetical protein
MKLIRQALSVLLTVTAMHSVVAQTPDLRLPEIQALRTEYQEKRAAILEKRRVELQKMLARNLEEQRRQQGQAKITGNTQRQADASQAIKLFEMALANLDKEDTFIFPAKIRPALERTVALCIRALKSEDEAREAGLKMLKNQCADRLQPLLAKQGLRALDPRQLHEQWQAVLNDTGAVTNAVQTTATAQAAVAQVAPEIPSGSATNEMVLATRGEAARWVPLAKIGVEVFAMEVLALPVADLTERAAQKGTGLESGAPWQAAVTPLCKFERPSGAAPAMRLRALPGMRPLDVVEWPSRRNDWMIEVRMRPPGGGASRHGGLLEIDAAAVAGRP